MKAEDFGYNPERTQHSSDLTHAEDTMLTILERDHVGKDNKAGATYLAQRFREEWLGNPIKSWREFERCKEAWKRDVRYLINHLVINHEQPILSKAGNDNGYWIAVDQAEVEEFYETFRKRAMTGLTKAARGRKALLAEMITQLTFEFDEALIVDRPVYVKPHVPLDSKPVTVVVALIDKMTREPERFARELELLREKFGKVLMPKEMFEEIRATSTKLNELLGRIT